MKHAGPSALALALALAAGSPLPASAQPPPDPAGGVDPFGQATPPPPAPPPPAPAPPPPEPQPVVAVAAPAPGPDGPRPEGMTVGLGFGYLLPASWDGPNVVSARLRLLSGMTIEPRVELSTSANTMDSGDVEIKDGFTSLRLAANLRFPLARRGRGDFLFVGGASAALDKRDPDGEENAVSTTSLALSWGIGIDYWLSRSFSISMTATNPVISHTSTTFEVTGDDPKSSSTGVGAVFDPALDAMLHLYF